MVRIRGMRASILCVLGLLAACGTGGGSASAPAGTTTTPVLAALIADRSGGLPGGHDTLRIAGDDPRLRTLRPLVKPPLPASGDSHDPACADCRETELTLILSDGTTATYRFDGDDAPPGLGDVATWVAAELPA
jgi:hypothetical protein